MSGAPMRFAEKNIIENAVELCLTNHMVAALKQPSGRNPVGEPFTVTSPHNDRFLTV